jgi:diguanylate cyclase (GGDEF)-like protein/PAS domain S-box-containing protein
VGDVKLHVENEAQLVEELEKLRYRESLLNAAEKIAHIGHCEWDYENDRLKFCSEEYAGIFGMTVDEVMTAQKNWQTWIKQIFPDDLERYESSYRSQKNTGSHDIEYRVLNKNGEVRHIREYAFLLLNDSGKQEEAFAIIQDITDLVKYRLDLEYRDALSQQAEASADIGHYIYDEKTSAYLYVSPGYARIHGVDPEQLMNSARPTEADKSDAINDVIYEEDHARVMAVYDQFFKDFKDYSVEYRIRHTDGQIFWVRELSSAIRINDGVVEQTLGVVQDITRQKSTEAELLESRYMLEAKVEERTEELVKTVTQLREEVKEREKIAVELKFHANHDSLTGLPSLRLCKDRLERSLAESRRNKQMSAVMFIDLDGFKLINDTHGHECGDIVLKTTADRIRVEIRETDTVARIGGDEFLIILSNMSNIGVTQRVAAKLIEQISKGILYDSKEITVGASIGIAIYPDDGTTSEEMIKQADKAMYLVKHSGKNNFGFTQASPPD